MGGRIKDLTGQTFGRLTVISQAGKTKRGYITWNTVCICGNDKVVESRYLTSGGVRSCGCLIKDRKPREKKLKYNYPRRLVGRPPMAQAMRDRIIELYNEGLSYREIQKQVVVSLRTISWTINENTDKLKRAKYTPWDNKRGKK